MSRQNNKSLRFSVVLIISIVLTLGLSISIQSLLAAWGRPEAVPPMANTSDFIIGGSISAGGTIAATGNYLMASGIRMSLLANNVTGQVSIGTITPNANSTLQINPRTSMEGLRIVSASNWSPLNIQKSDGTDAFRVTEKGIAKTLGGLEIETRASDPAPADLVNGRIWLIN